MRSVATKSRQGRLTKGLPEFRIHLGRVARPRLRTLITLKNHIILRLLSQCRECADNVSNTRLVVGKEDMTSVDRACVGARSWKYRVDAP